MELKELLKEVIGRGASDLHLVPGAPPTLRIAGVLTPVHATIGSDAVLGREDVGRLLEPFLSLAQRAMLAAHQDVNTSLVSGDTPLGEPSGASPRFRACVFWERGGLGAALRLIPTNIPTLSDLFPTQTEATFRGLINRKRGLILVVGPTGSGKSTTTASMVETVNIEREERIVTIEDTIEYAHTSKRSLISQREVGTDVESFEQGGLSALRLDPDVVLVGELRTPEAVRIAVALSETGHLVLTTMQANSVSEAVRRLTESFPENRETMQRMIARSLNAVIAQNLVPRADRTGRAAVHEIMIVNARIQRMIEDGETDLSLAIEAGRQEGMRSMDDSLLSLYRDGAITYELAWRQVQDRDRLGLNPGAALSPAAQSAPD